MESFKFREYPDAGNYTLQVQKMFSEENILQEYIKMAGIP